MNNIALRGFRLGMPAAEVKRRLPFLGVKSTDAYGRSTALTVVRGRQPALPELKGVGVIAFAFQDGKVSAISISYDDAIKWGSLGEFTARTSEALELPKSWTRFEVSGEPRMYLSCGDVWLTAQFVNPHRLSTPLLRLWDEAASRTYKQRIATAEEKRRLAEEKKKRAFKP